MSSLISGILKILAVVLLTSQAINILFNLVPVFPSGDVLVLVFTALGFSGAFDAFANKREGNGTNS